MTRKFDGHPFQGTRETTITYRFEPSPHGTLVTVRDESFFGRSEAAYGSAEIWEWQLAYSVLPWHGLLRRNRHRRRASAHAIVPHCEDREA